MSTSTNTQFDTMLKKYMPFNMLYEEVMKRDFFLNKVAKDQKWKNGEMQVPFMGGNASSFAMGQLTDVTDITEDRPALGTVSGYKEVWGSMIFNQRDLDQHGGMESSFLKILPDRLEVFIDNMKQACSVSLMNGAHIASYSATNADLVNGIAGVDRPTRLSIGQYVDIGIVGTVHKSGYISAINIDNKTVTIKAAKDLSGAVVDLSAATSVAVGDKFFLRGGATAGNAFTSLKSQLLSAANGGTSTLFGISKLAYPYLQCPNHNGSGITSANLLDKIFDFWTETKIQGRGSPTDLIMSYKHLGTCMKQLENGVVGNGRQYMAKDTRASVYGWTEIDIVGVQGKLTIVGVQEMDDDVIYMLDWRSLKLHSNGFFERRESPDGKQYFETRATTGYKYIVDTRFYGELVVSAPSFNGIIHSISY